MIPRISFLRTFVLIIPFILVNWQPATAQEWLCDPAFEDCYTPLLKAVQTETVGIDIALYWIELGELANVIISRHQAGVPVRITVEPRASSKFPLNQPILDRFKAAGIPMRFKLGDGILHSKMLLLAGQNKVIFSSSNFGDGDVRPRWIGEPHARAAAGVPPGLEVLGACLLLAGPGRLLALHRGPPARRPGGEFSVGCPNLAGMAATVNRAAGC